MTILLNILSASLQVFLISSPFILIGLAGAGLLHVLIPSARIAHWLGTPGFGTTARAALLGIPLPLCSCAVVPVTIELSRKGASREASLAFLVTTPETGVDSILLTYGLMGPVMTVVRPLAALATSLVAAAASMLSRDRVPRDQSDNDPDPGSKEHDSIEPERASIGTRLREGAHYGFVSMLDEIGFWLVFGLILTGAITALIPEHIMRGLLGEGPLSHVILLILGVPLYMCASASTPIAAALMFKGVSAGAALVFLLAGPATNASSLVVIARFFGRRFVVLYLFSVVATALLLGWGLDWALAVLGWSIQPVLSPDVGEGVGWVILVSAALLGLLLLASVLRGSWQKALREFTADVRTWKELLAGGSRRAATFERDVDDDCC